MDNLTMTKTSIFNSLILLSLICFGISGSLSHIFNLGLVLFLTWNYLSSKNEFLIEPSAKKLFLVLCSVFFVFIIRGIFHSDTWISIQSLSPMMSIPIIGLMILFTPNNSFHISGSRVENYAKIAIATTFFIYIIFSQSLAIKFGLTENFLHGLEIFSGNPVPFSLAVFGVSIFCLANWKFSNKRAKLISILCLFTGFWLAGISSGSRGTLLAIIIIVPLLIWLITQSFSLTLFTVFLALVTLWLFYTSKIVLLEKLYSDRIIYGIDTLLGKSGSDNSIILRMELWTSSLTAIRENFLWGYDNSNRFIALTKYLPNGFINFSHPHNDILASTISAGVIGGILAAVSLLSPILAGLLSKENVQERLLLAVLLSSGILITANVNTIFFNDITAAWLAFSTFLIWNIRYGEVFKQDRTI